MFSDSKFTAMFKRPQSLPVFYQSDKIINMKMQISMEFILSLMKNGNFKYLYMLSVFLIIINLFIALYLKLLYKLLSFQCEV